MTTQLHTDPQPITAQPTDPQPANKEPEMSETHYRQPGFFTKHVFNRLVARSTKLGISIYGSRVLETKGRKSGEPRRTPVNPLHLDGQEYLVSPRGMTQWIRNAKADDGRVVLILGRRRHEYVIHEVTGDERIPVLRAYLRKWKMEVGVFFGGVGPDSTDAELAAIADRHPVFTLEAR
jgi:deazaflavin-dependent oxidoreductase (nitroreductase family)